MGSVGGAIGAVGGALTGGALLGPVGAVLGGGIGSSLGGGKGLGQMLGTDNGYGAVNPIDQAKYSEQIAQGQTEFGANQTKQGDLAAALLAQSQGTGPNPAQAMLNQATNKNIQQGTGMIASQKGINPGLAARQATQMAGQANQQSAGQGAVMGAQQQLAAQQQLGNVYANMGQQNLQNQGLLNNALLGGAMGSQQINAGVASGNAQRNAGMIGGLLSGGGALGAAALAASSGAYVGGQARVAGDSPQNDTVHAMLSPGEIVIPRSKADDPEAAKEFVEHLLSMKKKRKAS